MTARIKHLDIEAELAKTASEARERRAVYAEKLEALEGKGGGWVVYTGEAAAAVWVAFTPDFKDVSRKYGLANATIIQYPNIARRLAANVFNGHGEAGHACTLHDAYEMELIAIDTLLRFIDNRPGIAATA